MTCVERIAAALQRNRRARARGGRRVRRSTQRPPAGRRRRRRRTTAPSSAIARRARRVLPTPPGPMTQSSRQSSCASSAAIRRSSTVRPTKSSSGARPPSTSPRDARSRRRQRVVQRDAAPHRGRGRVRAARRADEVAIGLPRTRGLAGSRQPRHVRAQRRLIERVGLEQPRREIEAADAARRRRRDAPAPRYATRRAGGRARTQPARPGIVGDRRRSRPAGRRDSSASASAGVARAAPSRRRHVGCGTSKRSAPPALRSDRAHGSDCKPEQGLAQVRVAQACVSWSGHSSAASSERLTHVRFSARKASSCVRRSNSSARRRGAERDRRRTEQRQGEVHRFVSAKKRASLHADA